jgi:hypothetical protein
MENDEVDKLVITDLRILGWCVFLLQGLLIILSLVSQIPDEVKCAKDFTAPVFVGCIFRCLRTFDKTREYPRALATVRAQKVNQTTKVVLALKVRSSR